MSINKQPFIINVEKDDFTGIKSISTPLIGLKSFQSYALGYFELASIKNDLLSIRLQRVNSETRTFGQAQNESIIQLEEIENWDFSVFDLNYNESESGQGLMTMNVISYKTSDYFSLDQSLPMIIDGERIMLEAVKKASIELNYEIMIYQLPVDIFQKICNGKEIKFRIP